MRYTAKNFILLGSCFLLTLGLLPGLALADNKPYIKTFGADVFTGGWFNTGVTCDTAPASRYQDPKYPLPSENDYTGGILTYAKSAGGNPTGGSSSQFAAFATGLIEGNSAPAMNFGFYSDGVRAGGSAVNARTFANSAAWGGAFQYALGAATTPRQSHCVPDYYSLKMPTSPAPVGIPGGGLLTTGTPAGIYMETVAAGAVYQLNNAPATIQRGEAITIFINGNVYIDRNITYELDTVTNVPKFTLIAKGSIYIAPGVSRLDGLYIAQPDPANPNAVTADTGVIWTCHANSVAPPDYIYPISNCDGKLTINGALIAKQLMLLRTNGNVTTAGIAEDSLPAAEGSANIAELINYHPSVVLDGPFFGPLDSSALKNKIDSVVSLPPIF